MYADEFSRAAVCGMLDMFGERKLLQSFVPGSFFFFSCDVHTFSAALKGLMHA